MTSNKGEIRGRHQKKKISIRFYWLLLFLFIGYTGFWAWEQWLEKEQLREQLAAIEKEQVLRKAVERNIRSALYKADRDHALAFDSNMAILQSLNSSRDSIYKLEQQQIWILDDLHLLEDSLFDAQDQIFKDEVELISDSIAIDSLAFILENFQLEVRKVTDQFIGTIDSFILIQDYSGALRRSRLVAQLRIRPRDVAERLLEIAFVYNETGQFKESIQVTKYILDLMTHEYFALSVDQSAVDTIVNRTQLQAFFKQLFPSTIDQVQRRYYPEFLFIPGDTFSIGQENKGRDEQLHLVKLDSFRMSRTEVTNWQFYLFTQSTGRSYPPPDWGTPGSHPVVNVSWYDAVAYANWLGDQLGNEKAYKARNVPADPNQWHRQKLDWEKLVSWQNGGYRLPTEAEWEFAARGGKAGVAFTALPYAGSNKIEQVAWYKGNAGTKSHPVGSMENPNPAGLEDMSGNVWEWCWDWYEESVPDQDLAENPTGALSGKVRALRGGSWYSDSTNCQVSFRGNNFPYVRNASLGFRLAQSQ